MLPNDLNAKVYADADAARKFLESRRWPDGAVCPHCQSREVTRMQGKVHRAGTWQCNGCRKQFRVTVGTLYERSHIPLNKWLLATHLIAASKKGISAHQLYRMLDFGSYRTAWFMAHRIREAMKPAAGSDGPLGGADQTVEVDETYIGGREKNRHAAKRKRLGTGGAGKEIVHAIVERGGRVRSSHLPSLTSTTLRPHLEANIDPATTVMSDEGGARLARMFEKHGMVNHKLGEFVRASSVGKVSTNAVEGYFSVLKRGITGTFHHVSPAHLSRYLAEFDFRHNHRSALGVEDAERATRIVDGIEGRRLTYKALIGRDDGQPA